MNYRGRAHPRVVSSAYQSSWIDLVLHCDLRGLSMFLPRQCPNKWTRDRVSGLEPSALPKFLLAVLVTIVLMLQMNLISDIANFAAATTLSHAVHPLVQFSLVGLMPVAG
ncbi:hypothetical protein G5V57_05245 [Nordella sp. HKS 07]|uniref:hypothetical protein n=1 Tax=Nordella sp. HKS 07 TaxID=2712222 RepID=UPI0013E1BDA2|nr:hypothetical protein [Nordella sp. HKS 07]QIG47191.1 hypothetical protein G5V57_05245 [Nordella sp. HKS 07]